MKRLIACTLILMTLPMVTTSGQVHASKSGAPATASKDGQSEITAIDSQAAKIGKYLAAGDADSLSALWTTDGLYTDSNADVYRGRDNLKKRFQTILATGDRPSVTLKAEKTQLLSKTVAVQEGTVLRKYVDAQQIPDTRYMLVMEKQKDNWLIASAVETAIPEADTDATPSLQDLAWMIGSWKAERNGKSLQLNVDWAGNKNFIRLNYKITDPTAPTTDNTEIIAIDPASLNIASWSFDSTGTIGQSVWTQNDKNWQVDSSKVGLDGLTQTARVLISRDGDNRFTWQSINQTLDGMPVSDTAELPIERVSH